MDLQLRATLTTTDGFRWRDRQGGLHNPREMLTRNLFFTLRMIWNHTMPEDARTHGFNRYQFSSFYSESYLKQAVRELAAEIATRDDMDPEWNIQLQMMLNYLRRNPRALTDRHAERIPQ